MKVGSIFAAGSAIAIALIPTFSLANGLFEDGSWQFQSAAQLQALTGLETLIQQKKGGAFGTPQTFQKIGEENIGTLNQGNNISGGSTLTTGGNTSTIGGGVSGGSSAARGGKGAVVGETSALGGAGGGGAGGGKGSVVGEINGTLK